MSTHTVPLNGRLMTADGHKTRRAALRVLAGASVLVVPTIGAIAGSFQDPIFVAIERHKSAYEAREATSFAIDDQINNPEGRAVSEAEWDALERAHENENAAFDALLTAPPESAAGMRAIIAHLISIDDGRLSRKMSQLLALLLKSQVFAS
jgi:hypothetical protein